MACHPWLAGSGPQRRLGPGGDSSKHSGAQEPVVVAHLGGEDSHVPCAGIKAGSKNDLVV